MNIQNRNEKCGVAIWSFVLSLLGFLCCGPICSIPGIICGHVARKEIRKSDRNLSGDGMALAGIIIGYFGVVITGILILFVALGMGIAAFEPIKTEVNKLKSKDNLKQMFVWCQKYSEENNGELPENLNVLADEYNLSEGILINPSSKDRSKPGYVIVTTGNVADFENPAETILIKEVLPNNRRTQFVMYLNGSIKKIKNENFTNCIPSNINSIQH